MATDGTTTPAADQAPTVRPRRYFRMVSAKTLHERTVRLVDRRVDGVSIFPFFDGDGRTSWLLLTLREPARLVILEWRPGLVEVGWLGGARVDLPWTLLDEATVELSREIARTWHFDPWWVLKERSLAVHPAAPPLYATNAVDLLEPMKMLWYAPDLSRVVLMTDEANQGRAYRPGRLPAEPPRSVVATGVAAPGTWRLSPFWAR